MEIRVLQQLVGAPLREGGACGIAPPHATRRAVALAPNVCSISCAAQRPLAPLPGEHVARSAGGVTVRPAMAVAAHPHRQLLELPEAVALLPTTASAQQLGALGRGGAGGGGGGGGASVKPRGAAARTQTAAFAQRKWLCIDAAGKASVIQPHKLLVTQQLGVQLRDLRWALKLLHRLPLGRRGGARGRLGRSGAPALRGASLPPSLPPSRSPAQPHTQLSTYPHPPMQAAGPSAGGKLPIGCAVPRRRAGSQPGADQGHRDNG